MPSRYPRFVASSFVVLGALVGLSACMKAGSGRYDRGPSSEARHGGVQQATAVDTAAKDENRERRAEELAPTEPEASPEADPGEDQQEPLKLACDDQRETLLYLSPDDSNSMSSPAQIRHRVLGSAAGSNNIYIHDIAIRPWEFMNYYSWDYPAAAPRELGLTTALAAVPGSDPAHPRWSLQIAVTSEAMTAAERPPINATLVLDTSGSMRGESLALLRAASEAIAGSLRAGDTVSVVEWDTDNSWSLANHRVTGPDDFALMKVLGGLSASGGTDLHGGLSSGYELAHRTWDPQAINRLVLISDGGANAGVTDIELISNNAAHGGEDGIYLVGIGVGDAHSYHDALMDAVTDAGKGASVFLGSEADAEQMFGERFLETMGVAARDVRVELTMPPGFSITQFSGEEYSAVAEEIEPQHLAPNDTMVFFQEIETCAPELVDADATIGVKVTWHDRDSKAPRELTREYSFGELFERPAPGADLQLLKGAAVYAYARGLQDLTRQYGGPGQALAEARSAVDRARLRLPQDGDLAEIDRILAALGG